VKWPGCQTSKLASLIFSPFGSTSGVASVHCFHRVGCHGSIRPFSSSFRLGVQGQRSIGPDLTQLGVVSLGGRGFPLLDRKGHHCCSFRFIKCTTSRTCPSCPLLLFSALQKSVEVKEQDASWDAWFVKLSELHSRESRHQEF
jgi:hypothetical protein